MQSLIMQNLFLSRKFHKLTLTKKVDRLIKIWAAPTFFITRNNGTVRFISDFRELNKKIKTKSFPIQNIQDLFLKLESFRYAT